MEQYGMSKWHLGQLDRGWPVPRSHAPVQRSAVGCDNCPFPHCKPHGKRQKRGGGRGRRGKMIVECLRMISHHFFSQPRLLSISKCQGRGGVGRAACT